ncbi:unnamed protein product, partial [Polarella glacialis]
VYFASYSKAKTQFNSWFGVAANKESGSSGWRGACAELMAGGMAGAASWGSCVPADNIKTLTQEAGASGRSISMVQASKEVFQRDGLRGFTRGGLAIVLRAFPVNAVTFMVYEGLKRSLDAESSL